MNLYKANLVNFLLIILFFFFNSCKKTENKETREVKQLKKTEKRDLFPATLKTKYAKGFKIEYHNNYKILSVFNKKNKVTDTLSWLLLPKGIKKPYQYQDLPVIKIPVQTMIILSTTHASMAEFLNAKDKITGISKSNYFCDSILKKKAKNEKIVTVGEAGQLNTELVIATNPDILMSVSWPEKTGLDYNRLKQANIPVIPNGDWLENSIMGRFEWVKVFAALTNKEKLCKKKFNKVDSIFHAVKTITDSIQKKSRPAMITGIPEKGAWYVPGGNSYMSNLMKTAGINYLFSDRPGTGGMRLDYETVYNKALNADIWLIRNNSIKTKKALLSIDKRFKTFKSFKQNKIFNNNNRLCNNGNGNLYWEKGIVQPHIILKDVIKLAYPQLLKDYSMIYHRKIK